MLGDRSRMNNTLTYRSPEFAGVQIYAQYSLEAEGQEEVHSGANQRYAALGATYNLGAFSTGLVVDTMMNARDTKTNTEDSLGISWGASYDLGVTKPMILVQYGKNENALGGFEAGDVYDGTLLSDEGLKGYAIAIGAVTPLFGGNLYTTVNYTDGETEADTSFGSGTTVNAIRTADVERWGVAVGYDYPLSKRTKLYGFAAYNEGELKSHGVRDNTTIKTEQTDMEAGVGLIHYF